MDREKINVYLQELVNSSQNINGMVIFRKNGQLLNYFLPEGIGGEKIALIGTILVGSSERACDELNSGNLKQIMVGGDFGKIIFISNGNDEFFGALAPFEVKYDDILQEIEKTSALMGVYQKFSTSF